MLNLSFQLIWQKMKDFGTKDYLAAISLALVTVSYGCVQKAQESVQLEVTSVQPMGINGMYNIEGSSNLPDSSLVSVAAVRYLVSTEGKQQKSLEEANINRSILAREIVQVKQGQWQADLNLWQVAPDGRYQEAWQANQSQMNLRPDRSVRFIATFEPTAQLKKSNKQLESKQLRFTNEGEAYLQAHQTLQVPLPTGKTVPPLQKDSNGILGNQSQPPTLIANAPLVSSTKFKQTNAPLKPLEFMR
ncbi:hypothetical protein F7734_56070 [Scytonema sp. UIC 10036]|uniref:hypothetical protein n=1 Tax=Scytonema sp. UIC 10036 TaxID=2304196 RepID=UPI0012DAE3EB|nr:hypothetical protein [Scytonema sp. UIC 10036]MUH01094.1 hypothetical protein [Scytonema sp. UIC 10036]